MRWTPWRKRSVILAVRAGEMTMREASERYMLSQEELASWIADFERRGVTGLLLKCGKREMTVPVMVTD
jgi:transposase